jgi:hypothetical protein
MSNDPQAVHYKISELKKEFPNNWAEDKRDLTEFIKVHANPQSGEVITQEDEMSSYVLTQRLEMGRIDSCLFYTKYIHGDKRTYTSFYNFTVRKSERGKKLGFKLIFVLIYISLLYGNYKLEFCANDSSIGFYQKTAKVLGIKVVYDRMRDEEWSVYYFDLHGVNWERIQVRGDKYIQGPSVLWLVGMICIKYIQNLFRLS